MEDSLCRRILWSRVSKAEYISSRVRIVPCKISIGLVTCLSMAKGMDPSVNNYE